jgi:hypothetical protein
MAAFATQNVGPLPVFANAYSRFDAPPGTSIAAATLDYELWRSDAHWFTGLQADDARTLDGCAPNDGNAACNASNPVGHDRVKTFHPASRSLRVVVACGDVAGSSSAPAKRSRLARLCTVPPVVTKSSSNKTVLPSSRSSSISHLPRISERSFPDRRRWRGAPLFTDDFGCELRHPPAFLARTRETVCDDRL